MAEDAVKMIANRDQANRNPTVRPKASRRKWYSPPGEGKAVQSSA